MRKKVTKKWKIFFIFQNFLKRCLKFSSCLGRKNRDHFWILIEQSIESYCIVRINDTDIVLQSVTERIKMKEYILGYQVWDFFSWTWQWFEIHSRNVHDFGHQRISLHRKIIIYHSLFHYIRVRLLWQSFFIESLFMFVKSCKYFFVWEKVFRISRKVSQIRINWCWWQAVGDKILLTNLSNLQYVTTILSSS